MYTIRQTPRPLDQFLGCGGEGMCFYVLFQPSPQIILLSYRENGAYDCGDNNR